MSTLFAIAYTEAALTALRAVEPQKVRKQIVKRISGLKGNPHPPGCVQVHGVMNGSHVVLRLRQGDYRVLYCLNSDTEILVLDIGHRKDVYRGM